MTLTINCPICEAPLPVRAEYAGLHLHCPHCSATIPVPATAGAPESPAPPITASEYVEEGRPFPRAVSRPDPSAAITDQAPVVARSGPGPRPQGRSYRPCPRCGDEAAVRVTWTPWGSFYGPALLTHVRCRQCGHAYNGKTGRSNALGIVFFTLIPLVMLLAVNVALWLIVANLGSEWRLITLGIYGCEGIVGLVLLILALVRSGKQVTR